MAEHAFHGTNTSCQKAESATVCPERCVTYVSGHTLLPIRCLRWEISGYPWLRHVFADGGYAGDKLRNALATLGRWTVQIIKRSDTAQGFEVLPRR